MQALHVPLAPPLSSLNTTMNTNMNSSNSNSNSHNLSHNRMLSSPVDPVRASVGHLLVRAFALPCSTAAQAFTQLVQPTARFQLALDALMPLLEASAPAELAQRILVSFILYALYAPHPIAINPFKSVLFGTFVKERERAVGAAKEGEVSPNEQLVWVLWKILKGDGNDIAPYSPDTLARSPLPPKLRATNLTLNDEMYNNVFDLDDATYSYSFSQKQDNYRRRSAASDLNIGADYGAMGVSLDGRKSGMRSPISVETDRQNERIAQAMKLLLIARERVLSLSEQRHLLPLIPELASSQMIVSLDLAPIVSHNPTLAHPLFIGLLTNAPQPEHNLPSPFLDVLPFLPPTLPTFDLFGRLLRDQTPVGSGHFTVSEVVRAEVLGRFVHECINWLDHAESDEREGLISDDRFAKGVQHLCRFYGSLIKLGIVDPAQDADVAEMAHFTLRHSRFEEATTLYRILATGKF